MVAGARTFSLEETLLPAHILHPPPTRHALLAFLLALAAVLHVGTAAWGDLYDGVEGQTAGAARAMATSGEWLVPSNNGVPQLETPPLACWTVALSFKISGIGPTAARLPIALIVVGTVALTFLIGERLAGYWRGFAAGLIYLCSTGAFVPGRLVAPDNLLALCTTAAIYCAIRGYQRQKFRRAWFASFWVFAALASLAAGPRALLLLAGTIVLVAVFFREARLRFTGLLHWTNLLLFLAIVLPWVIWTNRQFPGFAAQLFSVASWPTARWRFLALLIGWSFPALFLILPGLIFASRKVIRPNEFAFADALPLCWVALGLLAAFLSGNRHTSGSTIVGPPFALMAAWAWERMPRSLRAVGVALMLVIGVTVASATWFRPELINTLLARPFSEAAWISIRPLVQISLGALLVSAVAAFILIRQRGEVMLVFALAAMVPTGFCLIESGARVAPFLSLAEAAKYLNPRLGPAGEVVYEGSLRSANSLTFYLEKRFFLLHQRPTPFEREPGSQTKYLDEHYLVEAWDRSDPIYLIIDEDRVDYWRETIVKRVHIYHQVTSSGHRVVLSNQL